MKRNFDPKPLSELMVKSFPPLEWLVEKLIHVGSIAAISGAPGSFKTWIILTLAIQVARGDNFLGVFATKQTGVLLVDEEMGERQLSDRFRRLARNHPELPIHYTSLSEFNLTADSVDELNKFITQHNIGLVIFDSFVRIHNSDENSSRDMSQLSILLKRITKAGASVIFTHHTRKPVKGYENPSHDMRGSSDILAFLDCHIALTRKNLEERVVVRQTKLRHGKETGSFELEIVVPENNSDATITYLGHTTQAQNKEEKAQAVIAEVLAESEVPLIWKELLASALAKNSNIAESTYKNAKKVMVRDGKLFDQKGSKNSTYYSLAPFDQTVG